MKKRYTKPVIMFEDFALSTNIAAGCEVIVDTSSSGTCAYKGWDEYAGEVYIFSDRVSACVYTQPDEEDGICYHTFDGNNVFNS